MRDEIICVIILGLLISLFVYNSHALEDKTRSLMHAIDVSEEKAIEGQDATDEYNKVKKIWEKEKKVLFYICGHRIIMQIDENVNLGCEYMRLGDNEMAVFIFKKARILLEDLYEREKIRLDNIF